MKNAVKAGLLAMTVIIGASSFSTDALADPRPAKKVTQVKMKVQKVKSIIRKFR